MARKNPPFLEGFWTSEDFLGSSTGGERGIRTPVRAFGPQIDFESIPLRPLRYLSGRLLYGSDDSLFARKNPLKISAQASRRIPSVTATAWFSRRSSKRRKRLTAAPFL